MYATPKILLSKLLMNVCYIVIHTFYCMYLYTLTIGKKSCNMLSILKKLTLQRKLQTFVTNSVFLDKK